MFGNYIAIELPKCTRRKSEVAILANARKKARVAKQPSLIMDGAA
jgi:hypothetical protein